MNNYQLFEGHLLFMFALGFLFSLHKNEGKEEREWI